MDELFQIDWRIFITATQAWLQGGNPYGALPGDLSAGAFAYPPTTLTWLALFVPLGALGFYVWTVLQLAGWWMIIRKRCPNQLLLLCWSPMILHLVEGQSSLAVVLVLWAAYNASRRGWLWGLALAWALTKPQVALLPLAWLLWLDRGAPTRGRLWGGIALGTLLLAIPPTLYNPGIWSDWLYSLGSYRGRVLQQAAWQGPSMVLLGLAAYLWHRSKHEGWQWWLTAGLFPHTSFYSIVAVLPALRPRFSVWLVAGLGLAALLQGPVNEMTLTWILAGHMLCVWMINGGLRRTFAAHSHTLAVRAEK